ncbi:outer membrane protein assembly factor BamD [Pyrinomonas methylaliphatogenes]|jgi:outer membrane protein assembly factor BamD|uniref:Outer membrane assembly lipoprotein YfiO n=1 Tax=Pyrinomonas methylaliphatogenes TaxID=454194 RepID=A0A0B6WUL8_9BACT|nr:outer membrane protein assembly factor BamD [Pyrinomonas methylaliphatogenes]MBX5478277.1 outer membrane protein assembly factor BamD [Pyrinomonas methylaliphatogenes]CDM64933.1 outer membrane assembly lipoprotein YfiO [Pyrinomonas methylaliphatogenes]
MRFRSINGLILSVAFAFVPVLVQAQQGGRASDLSPAQRLEVMRSRLEAMRRSLNTAIAALNAQEGGAQKSEEKKEEKKTADDPGARLRGLEREVNSLYSDVTDLRNKQERAERYDQTALDRLEAAIADLDARVQNTLRATASERSAAQTVTATSTAKQTAKKKGGFFSRLFGHDDDKYKDLIGTVAPGRDRQLFEEASKAARKGRYDEARLLYQVIITTYPDSPYLSLAKLAIADTFYLEGTTSALIQAAAAYQDWLTFFPTDPLADDVLLKIAETEMRQMGLSDRDVSHARKAEQRLKALLQQFPQTNLRPEVEQRLREVQDNLAMHNLQVANFYFDRYAQGKASNPKGAQSRLREIVEKYPNFSRMDEVLFKLGVTYVQEEEPDEAAKFFQQLVRNYPNSEYAEKAREQLETIGAPIPEPDPTRLSYQPPPRPSFTTRLFREVVGSVPVTVSKDGVLISRDKDKEDLLDLALRNGGQLPTTVDTPTAPVFRRPPAQPIQSGETTPASKNSARPRIGSAPGQTDKSRPQADPSAVNGKP